ncbi:LytTR family transcriptional regulator [Pseudomonas sp. MPFS]|uniref:LytTR family DNA-binding domain-containing protein n=1 Tax=Pseudomonas sp. MPFS TaxID=2795724 RepID=UPI001F142CB6|nr:LytTR family DNA-binding domain-containing protein [Pseudomonas sp. MPFS]UMZ10570.1 LytTR family transcriptional regulator [Pseudomonas sp. MPFS]
MQILVIKAEKHYVRVTTSRGEELVLYRFSNALADVAEEDGSRVHRSYWVRRCAVVSRRTHGKNMELLMSNGVVVLVSRRYHELVNKMVRVQG